MKAFEDSCERLLRSAYKDVERYRQIRGEIEGKEIEWQLALSEWFQRGFPHWKTLQWNRAVNQAVRELEKAEQEDRWNTVRVKSASGDDDQVRLPHHDAAKPVSLCAAAA